MSRSVQLLLGGTIITLIVSLGGCVGTSYYGDYYDPYPYPYGGGRTVIIREHDHHEHYYRPSRPHRPPGYRPGGGHRPSIGRPVQLPSRPRPMPRPRR